VTIGEFVQNLVSLVAMLQLVTNVHVCSYKLYIALFALPQCVTARAKRAYTVVMGDSLSLPTSLFYRCPPITSFIPSSFRGHPCPSSLPLRFLIQPVKSGTAIPTPVIPTPVIPTPVIPTPAIPTSVIPTTAIHRVSRKKSETLHFIDNFARADLALNFRGGANL